MYSKFLVYVALDTYVHIYAFFFRYKSYNTVYHFYIQYAPPCPPVFSRHFSAPFCPPAFHVQPGALEVKAELNLKVLGQPAAPHTLQVSGSTHCWTSPHRKLGDNKATKDKDSTAL